MAEPWGHYTWNKPVTKRQILLQFHWHEVSKVFKLIEIEWWLSGPGGRGNGELVNGDRLLVFQDGKVQEIGCPTMYV